MIERVAIRRGDNNPEKPKGYSGRVSLADGEKFDREGFGGVKFPDMSAQIGFRPIVVNADGVHPEKQIQGIKSRSYYVIDGEGTFTIDDTVYNIVPGDLYIVSENSVYEYSGKMTLLEINIPL